MTLTPAMITFDTLDPAPLARWWADQTGGSIAQDYDGWFVVVALPSGPALAFQRVEDPTPGKNRVHLDLTVEGDLDAESARLVSAGARQVGDHTLGDFRWVTLADPDGNQFCVSGAHATTGAL